MYGRVRCTAYNLFSLAGHTRSYGGVAQFLNGELTFLSTPGILERFYDFDGIMPASIREALGYYELEIYSGRQGQAACHGCPNGGR
jgi:hypothetical protein